jgi:hypothetical protein
MVHRVTHGQEPHVRRPQRGQAGRPVGALRVLAAPFVVAPPTGARIRTRLRLSPGDEAVLRRVGEHLGRLAGSDLADRCRRGVGGDGRTQRKRALTPVSSSRWAGAVTRTSNDQWSRAHQNLVDQRVSLRRAIAVIEARLAAPVAARTGRTRGYASPQERFAKQQRLQRLTARLAEVEACLADGRVSVVRGRGAPGPHPPPPRPGRCHSGRVGAALARQPPVHLRRRGGGQTLGQRDDQGPSRGGLGGTPPPHSASPPLEHARSSPHLSAVSSGVVLLPGRRVGRSGRHRGGPLRRHLRPRQGPLVPRRLVVGADEGASHPRRPEGNSGAGRGPQRRAPRRLRP